MVVYTDGFNGKEGTTAAARWAGYWGISKTKIINGHAKLPNHKVFEADARAALLGLQAALTDPKPQKSTNIYICQENMESIQLLRGQPKRSRQMFFIDFQEATWTWPQRPKARLLHTARHSTGEMGSRTYRH